MRPNRPVRCGCGVAGSIKLELILRIASDSGIEAIELQRGRVKWRERRRGGENKGETRKFRDLRELKQKRRTKVFRMRKVKKNEKRRE